MVGVFFFPGHRIFKRICKQDVSNRLKTTASQLLTLKNIHERKRSKRDQVNWFCLKDPPLRVSWCFFFNGYELCGVFWAIAHTQGLQRGEEGGGDASLSLFKRTVTSGKVGQGKKAWSPSSWIWLCRTTLQQQLQREEERVLSLSFFLTLVPTPSSFSIWGTWLRVLSASD